MYGLLLESFILIAYGVLVPLVAVSCTSGLVAAIQSILQIQEQSIIHLVRLCTFSALLYLFGGVVHALAISLLQSAIRWAGTV